MALADYWTLTLTLTGTDRPEVVGLHVSAARLAAGMGDRLGWWR